MYKSNKFCDILKISKGTTAVIGSGGKTSLIGRLCYELACEETVIFTTTTHILRPDDMPVALSLGELDGLLGAYGAVASGNTSQTGMNAASATDKKDLRMVCIGSAMPDNPRKLSAPNASIEALEQRADYVLVEADGSKMLPIKAHKSYEPVIPSCSNKVILVTGVSAIGSRVGDKVHRVEEFTGLTSASADDEITAELIAKGIAAEMDIYSGYDLLIYVNQTDVEDGEHKAAAFAKALRSFTGPGADSYSLFAGSLKEGFIYSL